MALLCIYFTLQRGTVMADTKFAYVNDITCKSRIEGKQNSSGDNHCNCTINFLFHRIKIIRFTDCFRFTFILLNQNYCTSYIHYEFSPTCLALPSILLGPLSRQVHILNCVERMINTPTLSDSLYIPHLPK